MGDVSAQLRAPRRRRWFWTAAISWCVLLGAGKPAYDYYWRARQSSFVAAALRDEQRRRLVGTEIWHRLFWASGESPHTIGVILGLPAGHLANVPPTGEHTIRVEGRLMGPNRGRIRGGFEPATRPVDEEHLNPDAAGWQISLNFRDGRFVSAAADPPPRIAPPGRVVRLTFDAATAVTLFGAPFVWLGAILAGLLERTRGTRFGEVALAAALAGTVACAVTPGMLSTVGGRLTVVAVGGLAVLISVKLIRWLDRIYRSRRMQFCYDCGYDLTGNVSGICPECGAATYEGMCRARHQQAAAAADRVADINPDDELPAAPEDGDDDDAVAPDSAVQR